MSAPPIQFLLLPDPVADHRWLATISAAFPDLICPPWPIWNRKESVESYSVRCLDEWTSNENPLIGYDQPILLGGIGFGCPLAIEMSHQLTIRGHSPLGTLLIGGVRSAEMVPQALGLQWSMIRWLPDSLIRRWIRGRWFGITIEQRLWSPELRELSRSLISQLSMKRFKQILPSLLGWKRTSEEVDEMGLTIHQLHGRTDRIVHSPSLEVSTILMEGEHLIHLSHTGEVNRWIDAIIRNEQLRLQFAQSR